ncbi:MULTISPECIES: hypothetical protein [Bacteroidaceae]|uniref:HU family DNA-binding protein n=1 Tax=Bacteroidaceae TaxID=815 RepID=UPI00136352D5|nr:MULTISPECIES: hypothetical protein [Bacteroidaceae]
MLKYNVILQRNPRDEDAMPKYHARIISIAQDTISTIAKQLSEDCTPNEEDCLVVVDGIMKQIIAGLKEGKIVKIDRFGSFRLTIKNDGPNCPTVTEYLKDPASFNQKTAIAGVNLIFTPAKELSLAVKKAVAEKYVPEDENPSIKKAKEAAANKPAA